MTTLGKWTEKVLNNFLRKKRGADLLIWKINKKENSDVEFKNGCIEFQGKMFNVGNGEYASLLRRMAPEVVTHHIEDMLGRFENSLGNTAYARANKDTLRRLLEIDYGSVASTLKQVSPKAWEYLQGRGYAPGKAVVHVERLARYDLRLNEKNESLIRKYRSTIAASPEK